MSSRDGSGQSSNARRPAPRSATGASSVPESYDIDPAEIDRYLSGQPQRTTSNSRSSSAQATPEQLDRLRRMVAPEPTAPSTASSRNAAPSARTSSGRPASSTTQTASYRESAPIQASGRSSTARRPQPDDRYQEAPARGSSWDQEPDDYYDEYPGQWDEEGDPDLAGRSGVSRRQRPSMPELPRLTIPRAVLDAPILTDRVALATIAVSIVSLIGMAILVSNRISTLPPEIATHVSASGVLGKFAARDVVWRIPLLALMLTLMNVVIGVFAARFERFASRLVLFSALLVQFLAWVALIRIL